MNLRDTITAALRASGLSQRQVALRAKVCPATLCAYLRGRREITTETLGRLLAALGMDLSLTPREGAD